MISTFIQIKDIHSYISQLWKEVWFMRPDVGNRNQQQLQQGVRGLPHPAQDGQQIASHTVPATDDTVAHQVVITNEPLLVSIGDRVQYEEVQHNDMGDEMGDVYGTHSNPSDQEAGNPPVVEANEHRRGVLQEAESMGLNFMFEDGIQRHVLMKRVLQSMGQQHITFRQPHLFPDLYFQVLPCVSQQPDNDTHQMVTKVDTDHFHIVAAYEVEDQPPVPFTCTSLGYDTWSQALHQPSDRRVVQKCAYLPLASAIWEYTNYMKRGIIPDYQLEQGSILHHVLRQGSGQSFIVYDTAVCGMVCPVVFTALTKNLSTTTAHEVVTTTDQTKVCRIICPLQECDMVPGACEHIRCINKIGGWNQQYHEDFSKLARNLVDEHGIRRLKCHNKQIPGMRLDGAVEDWLYDVSSKRFKVRKQVSCETCGNVNLQHGPGVQRGLVYTNDVVCNMQFYGKYTCTEAKCQQFGLDQHYTGTDMGLVRYAYNIDKEIRGGVSTFTSANLLNDMLTQVTTTSTTLTQFWQNQVTIKYKDPTKYQLPRFSGTQVYTELEDTYLFDARQRVNNNMYDVAQLQLNGMEMSDVFGCKQLPECISGPSVLIFDGSSYGYPSHYDGIHAKPNSNYSSNIVDCIQYSDRCITSGIPFLQLKMLRSLLKPKVKGKVRLTVSHKDWSCDKFQACIQNLTNKPGWDAVCEALNILKVDRGEMTAQEYKAYKKGQRKRKRQASSSDTSITQSSVVRMMRFEWSTPYLSAIRKCILQLTCRAPIPLFIRSPVVDLVQERYDLSPVGGNTAQQHNNIVQSLKNDVEVMRLLQDYNPELYGLLKITDHTVYAQHTLTADWLRWCIAQVEQFNKKVQDFPDCSNDDLLHQGDSHPKHTRHDICYWADIEPLRKCNHYMVGVAPRYNIHGDNLDNDGDRACSKYPYYTKDLTQGLMVVLCGHCGGCVGYEVMHGGESPRMPFEWIVQHRRVAPDYIIYDNACNLANYAMMREPRFFKHTRFIVDRFHMYSHHNCAPAHNANRYPEIAEINTQMVEQFWRSLRLNKNSLAFMNKVNYSVVVRMAIYRVLSSRTARAAFNRRKKDQKGKDTAVTVVPTQSEEPSISGHGSVAQGVVMGEEVVQGGQDVDDRVDWGQHETGVFDYITPLPVTAHA